MATELVIKQVFRKQVLKAKAAKQQRKSSKDMLAKKWPILYMLLKLGISREWKLEDN